jgi:ceramide glucosyltransferase
MMTTIDPFTWTLTLLGLAVLGSVLLWHRELRRAVTRKPPARPRPAHYPSVTVIRPVRGADVGAAENFAAALDTGYPGEVETLFIFDQRDDPGLPIAREVIQRHRRLRRRGRAEVVVAGSPPPGRTGKLNAMMVGALRARGRLIAFGDSDTRPDRKVLRAAVETLLSSPTAGSAFAPVLVNQPARAAGDVLYALMQNALYSPLAAHAAGPARSLPFIMGQLMVFRREALDAIGGVGVAEGQLVDDMYIGKRVHEAGYENLMSAQPLHIATGGMSFRAFLPVYRRWMMFSKNGLPLSFTWRQWLLGAEFFVSLFALLVALVTGHWLGAPAPAAAFLSIGVSLNLLSRNYGGAPIPLKYSWAAWAFFLVSPVVLMSNLLRKRVDWRGREYQLDGAAALAQHAG